jgi:hypothetical protein
VSSSSWHELKPNAVFVNISFVEATPAKNRRGKRGRDAGRTIPGDTSSRPWPGTKRRLAQSGHGDRLRLTEDIWSADWSSKQGKQGPLRGGLLSTIKEVGTFDLGGITLSYGRRQRGMDQVFSP